MKDPTDSLADAIAQRKQSFERLSSCPVVEIVGVVDAAGAGCSSMRGEELWTKVFVLAAWRREESEIETRPLTVQQQGEEEELDRLADRVMPYSTIRIKARIGEDTAPEPRQALLEEYLGLVDSDEELESYADELQKPVVHEDPVFGTLTLDKQLDWFNGEAEWDGRPVSLIVSPSRSIAKALATAYTLWEDQSIWNRKIRDYAVTKLLPLKNSTGLDEEESPLTADEFEEKMELHSVSIYPNGKFEFWYNDGDLFLGHEILVKGSLAKGPTGADIMG